MKDLLSPSATLALMNASQGSTAIATDKLKAAKESKDIAKAEETARDFEAVFIAEMMKPMFEGLSTEAPFGGGKGEEVFRGMMLEEYGKLIAQSGGVGLASQVKEEMIRLQEQANNEPQKFK